MPCIVDTPIRFMRMAGQPLFGSPEMTPIQQRYQPRNDQTTPGGGPRQIDEDPFLGIPFQLITRLATALGGDTRVLEMPGDFVFSEEALQAVMQRLAEQTGPQGPRPASQEAINALPMKTVDESMLDDQGHAECTICMDPVEVGSQVTELPCKHWFHAE
ncbi:hypothetical protein KEM52_002591, partial [Ascosphaera acerosa]